MYMGTTNTWPSPPSRKNEIYWWIVYDPFVFNGFKFNSAMTIIYWGIADRWLVSHDRFSGAIQLLEHYGELTPLRKNTSVDTHTVS